MSTLIEWTQETWNPVTGCDVVSPGCTNCYAMRMAARIEKMNPDLAHYQGLTKPSKAGPVWTGKIGIAPEHKLLAPLRRKKPTTYFVNSMSDLFHEGVPDKVIDQVFAVMALCPQHTFQVLTKRSARMREYMTATFGAGDHTGRRRRLQWQLTSIAGRTLDDHVDLSALRGPLPNVWLGVSAERQKEADERIPDLLDTPAAIRFLSAEPLLGAMDLFQINEKRPMSERWPYVYLIDALN